MELRPWISLMDVAIAELSRRKTGKGQVKGQRSYGCGANEDFVFGDGSLMDLDIQVEIPTGKACGDLAERL